MLNKLFIFSLFYFLLFFLFNERDVISGDEEFYFNLSETISDQVVNFDLLSKISRIFYLSLAQSQNFLWVFILVLTKDSQFLLSSLRFILIFFATSAISGHFRFTLPKYTLLVALFLPVFYYSFTLLRDDLIISITTILLFNKSNKVGSFLLIFILVGLRFYWGFFLIIFILARFLNWKISVPFLLFLVFTSLFILALVNSKYSFYLDFSAILYFPFKLLLSPIPWQIDVFRAGIYENVLIFSFTFLIKIFLLIFFLFSINKYKLVKIGQIKFEYVIVLIFGFVQYLSVLNGPRQTIIFQIILYSYIINLFNNNKFSNS